ncbi:glycosyltransferase [Dokdonia pacifica]|nr:glycosyltransferase [Dokdonia pacifica]
MQTITHFYEHLKNVKPFLEKYVNYDPYDGKVHVLYISPRLCSKEYYRAILPCLELNNTSTHSAIMTSIEIYDQNMDYFGTIKRIDVRLLKWANYIVFPTILSDMKYMTYVLRLLYPHLQIVMNLDDNYHKIPSWHNSYKDITSAVQDQLLLNLSTFDLCICQNERLKDQYRSALNFFHKDSSCLVVNFPTLISRKSFENLSAIMPQIDSIIRIGVFSPSEKFLNFLPSLLEKLRQKKLELCFVIFDYKGAKTKHKRDQSVEFFDDSNYMNYFEDLHKMQLKVALFSVSEYLEYQSIDNYLEMAVLGVPTIVCENHPASFIIKKRESGLLVSKENDWELNICKVLEESNFRKILISHSAKMVWKHHSFTQKTLKKITSVLV